MRNVHVERSEDKVKEAHYISLEFINICKATEILYKYLYISTLINQKNEVENSTSFYIII